VFWFGGPVSDRLSYVSLHFKYSGNITERSAFPIPSLFLGHKSSVMSCRYHLEVLIPIAFMNATADVHSELPEKTPGTFETVYAQECWSFPFPLFFPYLIYCSLGKMSRLKRI
jgi:hypothetical protein